MLYAKLIGRIALFTCENIAHIEFYLQGLLPKILAIYTIKVCTVPPCPTPGVNNKRDTLCELFDAPLKEYLLLLQMYCIFLFR